MLRFLRKYSSSIGVKILYGVLAALFVIWGVGAIGGDTATVRSYPLESPQRSGAPAPPMQRGPCRWPSRRA